MTAASPVISLLWDKPQDRQSLRSGHKAHPDDLNLEPLVHALSIGQRYRSSVEAILQHPVLDSVTLNYRLDVLDDLLNAPALAAALEVSLGIIAALEGYLTQPQWEQSELRKVAWRVSELEHYILCIDQLHEALSSAEISSQALCALRETVRTVSEAELFQELKAELPDLIRQIRDIKSITIGINLDNELRPAEAILLAINHEPYVEHWPRFFKRLLNNDAESNVGPLHKRGSRSAAGTVRLRSSDSPILQPLFQDLADVMDQTCQPVAVALRRYVNINARQLVALQDEIAFMLGAVRLIQYLRGCGMPLCRPKILPPEARVSRIDDLYNLNLALRMAPPFKVCDLGGEIVTNDAHFDEAGRIFILTGPNRGGKTTYAQAVGLAHVMAQAGLFVPAQQAVISPVDAIFTHFAVEERPDQEAGRLGEEAQRLSAIFDRATPYSLLLFNESLASTSANESFYLARDIVRVVRLLGARAIFATHLHELAADAEMINTETEGDSKVISMVSMVQLEDKPGGEVARRTYKIVPGPPMGRSYAQEIARHYGISFDQLKASLRARQQIHNGTEPDQN